MGIEVRHSPNVKLAGNVAAQAGAGRARREDEQQARAAAERRAAQEAQIQAQYERDLMQAEIQAQRDQDQFERTKEMDAVNFQQQNEMFQKQGLQRANEAEAAFDRQLETIDYTYTAKEQAENAKIDQKIDWVEQNPRYTREEKDQMIAQLHGIKKPPTGKPDDVQKEIDTFIRPGEVGGVKGFYQRTQNGWEFKPHKVPDPPDVAKIYADAVKSLTRKSNEGVDIPPKKSEVMAHVREIIALQRELQKEMEQQVAPSENVPSGAPTREQQEARALAESFGVQFQSETPADLSVVAEDLKKTDVRAMTKKHGFKLDDLSVVPADANTTQPQRESQNEASGAARAPLGLKAEDLQAEYSKALRKSFATAKQAGVSPVEAEQVSEEHKAELMGLIRQSLLAEAQKYGQIGNAPPQEKARLMKLRSLLELWKGTVGNAAPTRGIKPPAPPQGEFE